MRIKSHKISSICNKKPKAATGKMNIVNTFITNVSSYTKMKLEREIKDSLLSNY